LANHLPGEHLAVPSEPLWCQRCLVSHGPGCRGTHRNDAGQPSCVFCLDRVPCPVARKAPRVPINSGSTKTLNKEAGMETRVQNEKSATALKTPVAADADVSTDSEHKRLCAAPKGCSRELRASNRSGYCGKHFHLTRKSHAARHATGHGRTGVKSHAARHANGHGRDGVTGTNDATASHASPVQADVREDRLNRLLLSFPMEDKTRIATAWLSGKI
jgi:hypothetical protein